METHYVAGIWLLLDIKGVQLRIKQQTLYKHKQAFDS